MTDNDGSNRNDINVCPAHSGTMAEVGGLGKIVAESTNNISRLFEKLEAISEKFQQKVEDLSRDFQVKFEALSKEFQDKLVEFARRPGWTVCIVMTVMSSIISIMGTFILYAHFANKV